MADPELTFLVKQLERQQARAESAEAALHGGGGGGTSGGVEAEVAVLKSKVDRLVTDVGEQQKLAASTREELVVLKERISHLPTKGYINTVVVASLALVAALIAFQQNIQSFFHIGHP